MTPIGDLMVSFYRLYLAFYGCPDLAAVATADSINIYIASQEIPMSKTTEQPDRVKWMMGVLHGEPRAAILSADLVHDLHIAVNEVQGLFISGNLIALEGALDRLEALVDEVGIPSTAALEVA